MHVLCVGSRRVRSLEGRRSFIAFRAIPRNMPSDAPGAGPSVQAPSRRRPYTGAGERNSSMESAKHPAKLRKQMAGEDEPADHQAESRLKDPDRCILPSENCMVPVRIENVMQEEQKKHDGPCPLMGSIPPERIAHQKQKGQRHQNIRQTLDRRVPLHSLTASHHIMRGQPRAILPAGYILRASPGAASIKAMTAPRRTPLDAGESAAGAVESSLMPGSVSCSGFASELFGKVLF